MKRPSLLSASVVAFAIGWVLTPSLTVAQDMAKTAPKNVKVLLDNDQVRVLETWLAPGGKTGMHSHPKNIVYFVTGAKIKQTLPDGSTKELDGKPGEVRWSEAVTHDSENVGTTRTKVLVIELKEPKK